MLRSILLLLALASLSPCLSSADECASHGFDKATVRCSDCEAMARFIPISEGTILIDQCKACCSQDESLTMYSSATLLVPPHMYQSEDIKKFIEKHSARFKDVLTVQIKSTPISSLKLKSHSGTTDQIRVEEWKSDQILDFITSRVVKTPM